MLVLHDITLFVTLFHYDLPQDLQNQYDGWLGMEFLFVYHIEYSIHIISSDCFFQFSTENSNNQVTKLLKTLVIMPEFVIFCSVTE